MAASDRPAEASVAAPTVSVVIPTYNRRSVVGEAIQSVLAQSMADFELLVVDDGSTDGTAAHVGDLFGVDPRVRVVEKPNGGTATARNEGVRMARGEMIAYLDSDDLWTAQFLASQLSVFEDNPDVDLVICDVRYEGHDDRKGEHLFGDRSFKPPLSPSMMCRGGWALPTAMMLRRSVAAALPFREDYPYAEDTEFLFRFHSRGHKAVLNHEQLAVWRNLTQGEVPKSLNHAEHARAHLRMLNEYRHMAEPPVLRKRRASLAREAATALARRGQWFEARPYARRWWISRWWRPRALAFLMRSYVARRGPDVP